MRVSRVTRPVGGSSGARLLIVEDDRDIADMLLELAQSNGYDAISASSGREMDRLLARQAADLILLDAMLPGEDGFSICRRLRADGDMPILMLTALGDEIDRVVGLELGADDYVTKPFNSRELIARIKALLRPRRQGRSKVARRLCSPAGRSIPPPGPLSIPSTCRFR